MKLGYVFFQKVVCWFWVVINVWMLSCSSFKVSYHFAQTLYSFSTWALSVEQILLKLSQTYLLVITWSHNTGFWDLLLRHPTSLDMPNQQWQRYEEAGVISVSSCIYLHSNKKEKLWSRWFKMEQARDNAFFQEKGVCTHYHCLDNRTKFPSGP